jgi:hypothetical protein
VHPALVDLRMRDLKRGGFLCRAATARHCRLCPRPSSFAEPEDHEVLIVMEPRKDCVHHRYNRPMRAVLSDALGDHGVFLGVACSCSRPCLAHR